MHDLAPCAFYVHETKNPFESVQDIQGSAFTVQKGLLEEDFQ
jgi:hypothetical protein